MTPMRWSLYVIERAMAGAAFEMVGRVPEGAASERASMAEEWPVAKFEICDLATMSTVCDESERCIAGVKNEGLVKKLAFPLYPISSVSYLTVLLVNFFPFVCSQLNYTFRRQCDSNQIDLQNDRYIDVEKYLVSLLTCVRIYGKKIVSLVSGREERDYRRTSS